MGPSSVKIKKMIEMQKREKKSREFELMAKMERLEAERLRKEMLEASSSDTAVTATTTTDSSTLLSSSSNTDSSRHRVHNFFPNRRKSDFVRGVHKPNTTDDLTVVSEVNSS
jgi:hypothetical protein